MPDVAQKVKNKIFFAQCNSVLIDIILYSKMQKHGINRFTPLEHCI